MKNQQAAEVLRDISPARIFARPTADDLWLGPTQESALRHLSRPLPVRVLLGPVSSGRTTLLRRVRAVDRQQIVTLSVSGRQRSASPVSRSLLDSAGLRHQSLGSGEVRRHLAAFLREQLTCGRRVVIQLDDADLLDLADVGEIAWLLKAGMSRECSPELVMSLARIDRSSSHAAEFARAIRAPALAVLSWMNPTEVGWYIHWRLERYGLADVITSAATRFIARSTHGCFAAVDQVCQVALLVLRNRETGRVNVPLVRDALLVLERQRERRGHIPGDAFGRDSGSARAPEPLRRVAG